MPVATRYGFTEHLRKVALEGPSYKGTPYQLKTRLPVSIVGLLSLLGACAFYGPHITTRSGPSPSASQPVATICPRTALSVI